MRERNVCFKALNSFFKVSLCPAESLLCVFRCVQVLVQSNSLSNRISVLEGDVRDVSCPDMVDVIVSEPMGYMLLNERVMESFLYARKWLKPNGKMPQINPTKVLCVCADET